MSNTKASPTTHAFDVLGCPRRQRRGAFGRVWMWPAGSLAAASTGLVVGLVVGPNMALSMSGGDGDTPQSMVPLQ